MPRDEIVKGYEFSKGQYVLFSKEELKAIEVVSSYSIDIEEFVPVGSVERIYFDKAYYLGPDKGGARAYQLLAKALDECGRIAIGRYAARGKQHLIMVRPVGGEHQGLMLEQLHYAEDIRSFDEVPIDDVEVKDAELELAKHRVSRQSDGRLDADLELHVGEHAGPQPAARIVERDDDRVALLARPRRAGDARPADARYAA